ncbi:MAG TPA: nuclear transport factor 2 family protein [Solirubrobacterales bacterium]
MNAPGERAAAEEFVERFASYWAAPLPEGLVELLAADVRLAAPLTPTTTTLADAQRVFARLLAAVPDLTGRVHSWGATSDGVLIEFTLSGTAGGRPNSWRAVDRFVLRPDGLASERVSYFDSLPLALTLLRRPSAWWRVLRARRG